MNEIFHPALLAEFRLHNERHNQILAQLARLEEKVDQIMSEDATVAAAAVDLQADAASLTTAVTALQGLITALQGESVSPATVQALQQAQAAVDAITATAAGDVTADQPPAAAPAAG
jgi:peptidoglycan hydrolase CwlO-like protein